MIYILIVIGVVILFFSKKFITKKEKSKPEKDSDIKLDNFKEASPAPKKGFVGKRPTDRG